jgi:hypothetical protein
MSVAYPPAVSYFVRRIMGVTTNQYKIEPNGSPDGLGSGQIITFELPTNALLDLSSVQMVFGAKVQGGTKARLPNKVDSLIERYSVEAGGLTIAQGFPGYNTVKHMKCVLDESICKSQTHGVSMSHENIPRAYSDITAGVVDAVEDYSAEDYFSIRDFLGFLGESSPKVMDCSLLPNLVLKVYLSSDAVLTNSAGTDLGGTVTTGFNVAGAGSATYTLNRMHLTCSVYGIMDGNYDRMVESKIVNEGFLEVPFKNYQTFNDGNHSGSSRFNLGCQSLDRLYAVWRPAAYNTQTAPVLMTGMKQGGTAGAIGDVFVAATSAGAVTVDFGTGFGRPLMEDPQFNGEKWISKYFDFPKPTGFASGQFNINGTLYPQWAATEGDWHAITVDAMNGAENQIRCRAWWDKHMFVNAVRLNLPEADKLRIVCGLDTRSINLSGMYNSTGVSGVPLTLVAEYTSSLRIGSGLQISLVI